MAGTFTPTTSYSNLTILELEQLRKADFTAAGKVLTVGDSGVGVGARGKGNLAAEVYSTGPSIPVTDVQNMLIPPNPGTGLRTQTFFQTDSDTDVVKWFGPTFIYQGTTGEASSSTVWQDPSANYTLNTLVENGDIIAIKNGDNTNIVNTVSSAGATSLTCSLSNFTVSVGTQTDTYLILRKNAIQLYAIPGSGFGSGGREQTFLMVHPYPGIVNLTGGLGTGSVAGTTFTSSAGPNLSTLGILVNDILTVGTQKFRITQVLSSTQLVLDRPAVIGSSAWYIQRSVHNLPSPAIGAQLAFQAATTDQVNSVRIRNIVGGDFSYTSDPGGNRSDSIFSPAAPLLPSLHLMGYRPVLYPDVGTGLSPNMGTPIAVANPNIDPSIAGDDQRMTIDLKAGVVRFSTAPASGGDILKPGGTNPVTGRLSLYATFWAMDIGSASAGTSKGLYFNRSTPSVQNPPSRIFWNEGANTWSIDTATYSGTPGSLSGTTFDQHISSLLTQLNNAQQIALLNSPDFSNIYDNVGVRTDTTTSTPTTYYSGSWVYQTSVTGFGSNVFWQILGPGLAIADGGTTSFKTGLFSQGSPTTTTITFHLFQPINIAVWGGETVNFKVVYRRRKASTNSTNLVLRLYCADAIPFITTLQQTVANCNSTDASSVTLTGSFTLPSDARIITKFEITCDPSPPTYTGAAPDVILEIGAVQCWLIPSRQNDVRTNYQREHNLISSRNLRFTLMDGVSGTEDAMLLYTGTGSNDQRITLGRVDSMEDDNFIPPTFEQRGQFVVGGGIVADVTRFTPRIQYHLSSYSGRTLRTETIKQGASGFAATREYAFDAGFSDYDMYEQTHNAQWNQTLSQWFKDQGSGSYASRLYVHNAGLVFQTETSVNSSFSESAWSPGQVTVGFKTRNLSSSGAVNNTDVILFVNTSGGPVTVTLPAASISAGRTLFIVDTQGTADTNPITLTPAVFEQIDNSVSSRLLQTYKGRWMVVCDGAGWFVFSC